jgi:large subunit ribosomal protein L9
MKVILTENIDAVGHIGDTVNVAPGFARNFLLPKGLAMEATSRNVGELEHKKRLLAQKRELVRQEMLSVAEKLNAVSITVRRKVADDEKIYGSVTSTDVAKSLEAQGFDLPRKSILMDQPIKALGEFKIQIRVDNEISATVRVVVEKEE